MKEYQILSNLIVLTFVVVSNFNQIQAQQFEWISNDFPDSRFLNIIEIKGKYFGIVSNGASVNYDPNTLYQLSLYELEIDQLGNPGLILNEITTIPFTDNYATISVDYIEETNLWLLAQSSYISDGKQRYRVILCNENFDIIAEQTLDTLGYPSPFHMDSYNGKNYILGSLLGPPKNELFYLKYSQSNPYYLPPIAVKQSNPQSLFFVTSMNIDKRTGYLLVFHYGGIALLDTNLHLDVSLTYENIHTAFHGTALGIQSNYFSHGGTIQNGGNGLRFLVFQKYDSLFNSIFADTFGIPNQDNYPFVSKSLDFNNNEFLVGGHLDGPLSHADFNKSIKKFYLAKYDEDMNRIWYKEYGGDRAYIMNGLKLLDDGTSLAYGYITDIPSGLWYAYILRVDINGEILTSQTISPIQQSIQVISPGDETLQIMNPDGLNTLVELRDIRGCFVLKDVLSIGLTEIDTGALPAGIYPYILIRDGRVIGSGNWVKGK